VRRIHELAQQRRCFLVYLLPLQEPLEKPDTMVLVDRVCCRLPNRVDSFWFYPRHRIGEPLVTIEELVARERPRHPFTKPTLLGRHRHIGQVTAPNLVDGDPSTFHRRHRWPELLSEDAVPHEYPIRTEP
jgi:hypothetical protein